MARFKISSCVAFESEAPGRHARLYSRILGTSLVESDGMVELPAEPFRFFFDDGEPSAVFELLVDDLDEARAELAQLGFVAERWEGAGRPCYMRDPFGVLVNLYPDPEAFSN